MIGELKTATKDIIAIYLAVTQAQNLLSLIAVRICRLQH